MSARGLQGRIARTLFESFSQSEGPRQFLGEVAADIEQTTYRWTLDYDPNLDSEIHQYDKIVWYKFMTQATKSQGDESRAMSRWF